MSDSEAELDKTVAAAQALLKEAEALAASAKSAAKEKKEWMERMGITEEAVEKFKASLTGDDLKKAEEEQERFYRDLNHDIETALERAKATGRAGKPAARRRRDMV